MQEPGAVTNVSVGQFADPRMSTNRVSRTFPQPAQKLHGEVSALRTDLTSNCRYILGRGIPMAGVYLWESVCLWRVYLWV